MPIGLQIIGLRAEADPRSLAARQPSVQVRHVFLRLSDEALDILLRPAGILKVERIRGGHLFVRVKAAVEVLVEFWPSVSSGGRVRLEPVRATAGGFFPLPPAAVSAALGFFRQRMVGKPGLHLTPDNVIEFDLGDALRDLGTGVYIPRLVAVRPGEGMVELEYGPAPGA